MIKESQMPRRDFLKTGAILATAATMPTLLKAGCAVENKRWLEGKLNIAVIGLGVGFRSLKYCSDENIVAICDVDERRLENRLTEIKELYPDKTLPYAYQDYRKMFAEIGNQINAVVVATPDHTHTNITLEAMKLGKHVYCQKPLTHTVFESRLLTKAAEKYNVVTQMGNQGASTAETAWICEAIWDGTIGEIREVHAWTNRPVWPQALNRPEEAPGKPKEVDWDLWLGPAPVRPYSPVYHPFNWRGWFDFGTGALGDMACHILDVVMRSLQLKYPTGIEASTSKWTIESPAEAEKITYYFPERENYRNIEMPEVKVTWYDGGLMPDRPTELDDGESMGDKDGGVLFIGSKGKIVCGCYARDPKLLPAKAFENYSPEIKERIVHDGFDGHEKDWIRACKENPENRVQPKSPFAYAGPFNEVVVMGTVAARLSGLQRILKWDGENMKFTNISVNEKLRVPKIVKLDSNSDIPKYVREYEVVDANEFAKSLIRKENRKGWEVDEDGLIQG
jgi:predicted dehydrogenase